MNARHPQRGQHINRDSLREREGGQSSSWHRILSSLHIIPGRNVTKGKTRVILIRTAQQPVAEEP